MSVARVFAERGFTLSGRNALFIYGLTSDEKTVTFVESKYPLGLVNHICFVEKSNDINIINGFKCASIEKSLIDYMKYPYDDSGITEAVEMLDKGEVIKVFEYAKKTNNVDLLKDKKWRYLFEEAGVEFD